MLVKGTLVIGVNYFDSVLILSLQFGAMVSFVYGPKNISYHVLTQNYDISRGWVGLWGFLWWAPSAKRKDHHGVSSGWSSVWHRSNTGLSSTQYEQIPIILGVWPFWLTPFFFSVNSILAGLWLNSSLSQIPRYLAASGSQRPNPEHAFHRGPACDTATLGLVWLTAGFSVRLP